MYTTISTSTDFLPPEGAVGKYFRVIVAGVGKKQFVFFEERVGDRVIVSDEGYWNPNAATGQDLVDCVAAANAAGRKAGAVITPYALPELGGTATHEQLIDQFVKSDFATIDPYMYPGEDKEAFLLQFSRDYIEHAHHMGKKITLCMQGFANPGMEEKVKAYNMKLAELDFDEVLICDAIDFYDIPDEWQIDSSEALAKFKARQVKPTLASRLKNFFKKLLARIKSIF